MWLLFGNNTICTDCLLSLLSYKFFSRLSVFFHSFFLISLRTYGLYIWEMLSMVEPSLRTHCLCEVIHIWSSLLLLIITHHYYKQVQSWLPYFWLQGKKKETIFWTFRRTLEKQLWRFLSCCHCPVLNRCSLSIHVGPTCSSRLDLSQAISPHDATLMEYA